MFLFFDVVDDTELYHSDRESGGCGRGVRKADFIFLVSPLQSHDRKLGAWFSTKRELFGRKFWSRPKQVSVDFSFVIYVCTKNLVANPETMQRERV